MKIVVFTAVNKIDAIFFLGHKRKIDERYEEKGCKKERQRVHKLTQRCSMLLKTRENIN